MPPTRTIETKKIIAQYEIENTFRPKSYTTNYGFVSFAFHIIRKPILLVKNRLVNLLKKTHYLKKHNA